MPGLADVPSTRPAAFECRNRRSGLFVRLSDEDLRFLRTTLKPRRRGLSRVVLDVLRDVRTLFDLPRPMRSALESDMANLGLTSNRDYLLWLLMERYRARVPDAARGAGGTPTPVLEGAR